MGRRLLTGLDTELFAVQFVMISLFAKDMHQVLTLENVYMAQAYVLIEELISP